MSTRQSISSPSSKRGPPASFYKKASKQEAARKSRSSRIKRQKDQLAFFKKSQAEAKAREASRIQTSKPIRAITRGLQGGGTITVAVDGTVTQRDSFGRIKDKFKTTENKARSFIGGQIQAEQLSRTKEATRTAPRTIRSPILKTLPRRTKVLKHPVPKGVVQFGTGREIEPTAITEFKPKGISLVAARQKLAVEKGKILAKANIVTVSPTLTTQSKKLWYGTVGLGFVAVKSVGLSFRQTLRHPLVTLKGLGKAALDPLGTAKGIVEQAMVDPVGTVLEYYLYSKAMNLLGRTIKRSPVGRFVQEELFIRSVPPSLRKSVRAIIKSSKVQEKINPTKIKSLKGVNFLEVKSLTKIEAIALKKAIIQTDSVIFGSAASRTIGGKRMPLPKDVDLATKSITQFNRQFFNNLPKTVRKNYVIKGQKILRKSGNTLTPILDVKPLDRIIPQKSILTKRGRLPVNIIKKVKGKSFTGALVKDITLRAKEILKPQKNLQSILQPHVTIFSAVELKGISSLKKTLLSKSVANSPKVLLDNRVFQVSKGLKTSNVILLRNQGAWNKFRLSLAKDIGIKIRSKRLFHVSIANKKGTNLASVGSFNIKDLKLVSKIKGGLSAKGVLGKKLQTTLEVPTQKLVKVKKIRLTGFGEQTTRKGLGTLQVLLEKNVKRAKDPQAFLVSLQVQLDFIKKSKPLTVLGRANRVRKIKVINNAMKILKSKSFSKLLDSKVKGLTIQYPLLSNIDKIKLKKISKSKATSLAKKIIKTRKIPKNVKDVMDKKTIGQIIPKHPKVIKKVSIKKIGQIIPKPPGSIFKRAKKPTVPIGQIIPKVPRVFFKDSKIPSIVVNSKGRIIRQSIVPKLQKPSKLGSIIPLVKPRASIIPPSKIPRPSVAPLFQSSKLSSMIPSKILSFKGSKLLVPKSKIPSRVPPSRIPKPKIPPPSKIPSSRIPPPSKIPPSKIPTRRITRPTPKEKKKKKDQEDERKKLILPITRRTSRRKFIYIPDLYSNLLNIKANAKERRAFLKKGAIFTGHEIRKLIV